MASEKIIYCVVKHGNRFLSSGRNPIHMLMIAKMYSNLRIKTYKSRAYFSRYNLMQPHHPLANCITLVIKTMDVESRAKGTAVNRLIFPCT